MTIEETNLLFQDICGRLRSGLICSIYREDDEGFGWRDAECKGYFQNNDSYEFYFEDVIAVDNIERLKPYLRPMSSMTDEEEEEYDTFFNTDYDYMDASKVFDESVNRFYEISTGEPSLVRSEYCCNSFTTSYSAPTLQMTLKWLREIHKIHINLDIHWLHFANQNGWMYVIERILDNGVDYVDSKGDSSDLTFFSTYEEACERAIKYVLKNLI